MAGPGTSLELGHNQPSPQFGYDLVPGNEGRARRTSGRRKQGNQATTRSKHRAKQPEVRPRVRVVEAARQDHDLRNTLFQSGAMDNGVRTDRTPRHDHMIWGEGGHLLAEPGDGSRTKTTTRPSESPTARSQGRGQEPRSTKNKETTEAGNGPTENTRNTHNKNHLTVFYFLSGCTQEAHPNG